MNLQLILQHEIAGGANLGARPRSGFLRRTGASAVGLVVPEKRYYRRKGTGTLFI